MGTMALGEETGLGVGHTLRGEDSLSPYRVLKAFPYQAQVPWRKHTT